MAHLLGVQDAGTLAGSRKILADFTAGIADGDRIGVLGPNGAGKSTLLRLLAGTQELEQGLRTVTEGVDLRLVGQVDQPDPQASVREVLHGDSPEYKWASDPDVRSIHEGLLSGISLQARTGELSGGQRRRVCLAAALVAKPTILPLDEPTNHLDVEGVAWLAQYLRNHRSNTGALVVVTHDRWFLDAVCSYIWEVVPGVDPGYGKPQIPGHVEIYEGSYAAYILAREERAHSAQVAAEKRQNALRKELAWLRRGAPARTSKPKFRIEAAEALIANVPPPRDKVELVSMATSRLGKRVIDLEDVSFAYPDSEPIIKDVTWRLAPGERVGIVGVNGAGKTTLLRLLRGELEPTSGHIRRGKTVQLATLSQATHELDALAERRVVEAVADVKQSIQVAGKEVTATQLVERLGFTRERAWTRIAEISGGERRRLQLMRLLMAEPNVLLLDEPTNDLDTDTLAQMEDLLDSFPGTLVVVSHDRYLLERATDHQMALLPSGALADLPGGVEQYLAMREGQVEKQAPAPKKQNTDAAAQYAARKQARSLERKLDKSRAQIAKVEQEMAALSASLSPQDVAKLAELNKKLQQMQAGQDQLEEEWLEAAEKAEGN